MEDHERDRLLQDIALVLLFMLKTTPPQILMNQELRELHDKVYHQLDASLQVTFNRVKSPSQEEIIP